VTSVGGCGGPSGAPHVRLSRWAVLVLVTLAHALGALAVLSVAPLSPFLLDALHLSRAQVGLLLPAVYLGGVLMSLPAGWITDRLGVRVTLGVGQAVIGVLVLVAALAGSLGTLLACLVLAGFGFSVLNPATGKAVLEWFPPHGRGLAMGIKQTGLTLGGLVGALALPPLALGAGWRSALAAGGALALVSAAVTLVAYRTPAARSPAAPAPWPRLGELRVFLRRPGVIVVFLSGLALSVAQSSVLAHLAIYARETFALSPVAAGQMLALAQAGGTASRLAWGAISDRSFGGRRRPGVVVNALIGAGAYALLSLGDRLPAGAWCRWRSSPAWARSAGSGSTSRWWRRSAARATPGCSRASPSRSRGAASSSGRPSSACWWTARARTRGHGWGWPPSALA